MWWCLIVLRACASARSELDRFYLFPDIDAFREEMVTTIEASTLYVAQQEAMV